jgi:sugar phosphate isomerase/epimerase
MNRRDLLKSAAALVASGPFWGKVSSAQTGVPAAKPHIIWMQASRYSQWVTTPKLAIDNPRETGVRIGQYMRQIGHAATDLGVRRGAHVDPVYAAQRLGPMVEGIRSTGIVCDMITTEIRDLSTPVPGDIDGQTAKPEDIIAAASRAGIKFYRTTPASLETTATGPFGAEVRAQLKAFGTALRAMEALNKRHNIRALFHTFSGARFTASFGDFLYAADGIDPAFIGFNWDTGHMFTEGVSGGWRTDLRAAQPFWGTMALKDVGYARMEPGASGGRGGGRGAGAAGADPAPAGNVNAALLSASAPTGVAGNVAGPGGGGGGNAQAPGRLAWVKPGTGLVPFTEVFQLLLQGQFNGMVESQDEYSLNGIGLNNPFWTNGLPPQITPEQMMANQKQDLDFWKSQAKAAGWTAEQQT